MYSTVVGGFGVTEQAAAWEDGGLAKCLCLFSLLVLVPHRRLSRRQQERRQEPLCAFLDADAKGGEGEGERKLSSPREKCEGELYANAPLPLFLEEEEEEEEDRGVKQRCQPMNCARFLWRS